MYWISVGTYMTQEISCGIGVSVNPWPVEIGHKAGLVWEALNGQGLCHTLTLHSILEWVISAWPTWQGVKASALVFAGISSLDSAGVHSWEEMGILWGSEHINTLRPRQDGHRFPDDTFERIFLKENVIILIKISLKFVPNSPIDNITALV